jgi:hypothetical protein
MVAMERTENETMTISEARAIAADPAKFPDQLRLARLKLGNAALRAFPSSPRQKAIQAMVARIETMPRDLWVYPAITLS